MLEAVARYLQASGVDLVAWGLAFARVGPVLAIVPAFGLRAMSIPVRAGITLLLALVILPALRTPAQQESAIPALLLLEVARGTAIAVSAAVPLYVASMAGGVIDALRGAQELVSVPTVEGRTTPLGVLFSLLASALFLGMGGPARILGALVRGPFDLSHGPARIAEDLASGVAIAVALGAPLAAASIIVEIAAALIARAASPAHLHALLAPARSLLLLCVTAILLERIAGYLALVLDH
jgi:type III secretory pathway component EscT